MKGKTEESKKEKTTKNGKSVGAKEAVRKGR